MLCFDSPCHCLSQVSSVPKQHFPQSSGRGMKWAPHRPHPMPPAAPAPVPATQNLSNSLPSSDIEGFVKHIFQAPRKTAADLVHMARGNTTQPLRKANSSCVSVASRLANLVSSQFGPHDQEQHGLCSGRLLGYSQWPSSQPLGTPPEKWKTATTAELRHGHEMKLFCLAQHDRAGRAARWHETELVEMFDLSYELFIRRVLNKP